MLEKSSSPQIGVTPRIAVICVAAVLVIAAFFLLSSPFLFLLLLFVGYSSTRHAPKALKFVAILMGSVIVALFLRYAGFNSDALNQAHKYDAEIWPGFHHLCVAPASYDTTRGIGGYDRHQPLRGNEVRAVASSSEGKAWFAGPPCHIESRIRLLLSWLSLAIPAIYGFLLFRGRARARTSDQEMIST